MVNKAAAFAAKAHQGQFRKGGDIPYFAHCAIVADLVRKHCSTVESGFETYRANIFIEQMVAAAFLHDVVEDTDITIDEIEDEFDTIIAGYVLGLTNAYTKKAYPDMNREQRKKAECLRLGNLDIKVKQIKLCDRYANVVDMQNFELGFQRKYFKETEMLLQYIGSAHLYLTREIREIIDAV
jgi:(p)ppGpp synthase/HD superfamily hydrolase